MALLRKARTLTLRDWGVIAEAWFTLAWVKVALRVHRRKSVERAMSVRGGTGDDLSRIARLFAMAAGHHVTETNCLPRAIALQRMALRRGATPLLRIGIRKDARENVRKDAQEHIRNDVQENIRKDAQADIAKNTTRVGHAWLELNGVPFNERADVAQLFTVLDRAE